jgi:hypothetical protein
MFRETHGTWPLKVCGQSLRKSTREADNKTRMRTVPEEQFVKMPTAMNLFTMMFNDGLICGVEQRLDASTITPH